MKGKNHKRLKRKGEILVRETIRFTGCRAKFKKEK